MGKPNRREYGPETKDAELFVELELVARPPGGLDDDVDGAASAPRDRR
jgi:hypothetical protein